tara:strand:+ start:1063 stop:1374 length:312 start_codon:yes stop_codon:yes gene_type:complete
MSNKKDLQHVLKLWKKTDDPCVICNTSIAVVAIANGSPWLKGANAEPVKEGRCCDDCDELVVNPARMKRANLLDSSIEIEYLSPELENIKEATDSFLDKYIKD